MSVMAITAGIAAAVVVWVVVFKLFFRDADEFGECIRFWLTPDLISLFRGEYGRDWWAEAKLGLWLGAGAVVGFGVFSLLSGAFSP